MELTLNRDITIDAVKFWRYGYVRWWRHEFYKLGKTLVIYKLSNKRSAYKEWQNKIYNNINEEMYGEDFENNAFIVEKAEKRGIRKDCALRSAKSYSE